MANALAECARSWKIKLSQPISFTSPNPTPNPPKKIKVLKVEDLSMVKVIQAPPDLLLTLSQYYYGDRGRCAGCKQALPAAGALHWCGACGAAAYCGEGCLRRHAPEHGGHCHLCRELSAVLSIDYDRYVEPVPFR
jgi:hypothetical protein